MAIQPNPHPPIDRDRIEAQEAFAYQAWSEVNRVQLEAYEREGKGTVFRNETAAKVIMVVAQLAMFAFIPLSFFTGMPHWVPVVVMLGVGIISSFALSHFQSKATLIREQHKIDLLFQWLMRAEKEVFEKHPHLALSFRLPPTQGSVDPFDVEALTKDQQKQSGLERALRHQEIKTDPRLWWHARERKRLAAEAPGSLREAKLRADALGIDLTPSFRRAAAERSGKCDSWREVQAQVRVAKEALEVANHQGYVKGMEAVDQIIGSGNLLAKIIWANPDGLTPDQVQFKALCLGAIHEIGGIGALTEAEVSDLEGSPDWAIAFIETLQRQAQGRSPAVQEMIRQGLENWSPVALAGGWYHSTILQDRTESEVLASKELTERVVQNLKNMNQHYAQSDDTGSVLICVALQKMIARWESYHSRYMYYRQLLAQNHQLNQINQRPTREPFVQFNRRALEVEILRIKRENYRLSSAAGRLPMPTLNRLKRRLDDAHITAVSSQLQRLTDEQALEVLNGLPCRIEVGQACLRVTGVSAPIPLNQAKRILSQVNHLEIDLAALEERLPAPHFRRAIAAVHQQHQPLIQRWREAHDRAVASQIARLTDEDAFQVLHKLSCWDDIETIRCGEHIEHPIPVREAKAILARLNPEKIELEMLESYLPEPHYQANLPQNDGNEVTDEELAPLSEEVTRLSKLIKDNGTTHRQRFWRALTTPLERDAMPQGGSRTERAIRRQMQRNDLSIYRTRQYGIALGVSLVAIPAIAIMMILITNIWAQLALTTAYALLPIVVIRLLYGRITRLEKDIDRLRLEEWLYKRPIENTDVQTQLNRLGLDLDGTAKTVSRLTVGDKFGASEPLRRPKGGPRIRGYGSPPQNEPPRRVDDPIVIQVYQFVHQSDKLYQQLLNDIPHMDHLDEAQRNAVHQLVLTKEYRRWLPKSQDEARQYEARLPDIIRRMEAFAEPGEQACLYDTLLRRLSAQPLSPPLERLIEFVYPVLTLEQKIAINAKRTIPERWSFNDLAQRQIGHIEELFARIPQGERPVEQLAISLRRAPEIAHQALSRYLPTA